MKHHDEQPDLARAFSSASPVTPLQVIPMSILPITKMQEKHYGKVLNPSRWWGRVPFLFYLVALFVGYLERKRSALNPVLRALVMVRVSQRCHCAFCIDANSLRLAERTQSLDKMQAVSQWESADCFTEQERIALAYSDGMTDTPPKQDAELLLQLKAKFSEQAITELTALIAFQNLSARFNAALNIPSQGLCEIPTSKGQ